MLDRCKQCVLCNIYMPTNMETVYYCIAKQYPCDMITECNLKFTIEDNYYRQVDKALDKENKSM